MPVAVATAGAVCCRHLVPRPAPPTSPLPIPGCSVASGGSAARAQRFGLARATAEQPGCNPAPAATTTTTASRPRRASDWPTSPCRRASAASGTAHPAFGASSPIQAAASAASYAASLPRRCGGRRAPAADARPCRRQRRCAQDRSAPPCHSRRQGGRGGRRSALRRPARRQQPRRGRRARRGLAEREWRQRRAVIRLHPDCRRL